MTGIIGLLYGWHKYTDIWGQQKRVNPGWAHNPAKNLIRFAEDLTRFPDLDVILVDVITELILESASPLDPVSTVSAAIYDFYSTLDQALTELPSINVSVLLILPVILTDSVVGSTLLFATFTVLLRADKDLKSR